MELELIHHQPQKVKFQHPLLFLHGAYSGAWCWEEHFLEYFSSIGFECIALSLRGHGGSDSEQPLDQLSLKDYQDDLFSVIDTCSTSPVAIGHSMGGYLLQQIQHSKNIHASVLMASTPPSGLLPVFSNLFVQDPIRFQQWNWGNWMNAFQNVGTFSDFENRMLSGLMGEAPDKDYRHRYHQESKKALWEMCWAVSLTPSRRRQPMLVMGGLEDQLIPESFVRQTALHYGADYQLIQGAGHSMMLGPEWEKSAEVLEQWLTGNVS